MRMQFSPNHWANRPRDENHRRSLNLPALEEVEPATQPKRPTTAVPSHSSTGFVDLTPPESQPIAIPPDMQPMADFETFVASSSSYSHELQQHLSSSSETLANLDELILAKIQQDDEGFKAAVNQVVKKGQTHSGSHVNFRTDSAPVSTKLIKRGVLEKASKLSNSAHLSALLADPSEVTKRLDFSKEEIEMMRVPLEPMLNSTNKKMTDIEYARLVFGVWQVLDLRPKLAEDRSADGQRLFFEEVQKRINVTRSPKQLKKYWTDLTKTGQKEHKYHSIAAKQGALLSKMRSKNAISSSMLRLFLLHFDMLDLFFLFLFCRCGAIRQVSQSICPRL